MKRREWVFSSGTVPVAGVGGADSRGARAGSQMDAVLINPLDRDTTLVAAAAGRGR